MKWIILILMASNSFAQDNPYFLRATDKNQDLGGTSANNNELSTRNRNRLTTAQTPNYCPTGQVLSGAFWNKSGATVGGTCIAVSTSANISSSGVNVFTSSNTFNDSVIFNSSVSVTQNAPNNPISGGIYKNTIVSAAGIIDGNGGSTHMTFSVGVTSVSNVGTGQYLINFVTPYTSSMTYIVSGYCDDATSIKITFCGNNAQAANTRASASVASIACQVNGAFTQASKIGFQVIGQ